jgi:cobalt-zinc-cadmium efflux system outer membrane protein
MARWLLSFTFLLGAALAVPGCLHPDQDHFAATTARNLATLPRDSQTQVVLNTPKPEIKQPPKDKQPPDPFKLPPQLVGSEAPPVILPPDFKKLSPQEQEKVLQKLYPQLLPLEPELVPQPGPGGAPLDLPALQRIGLANNPTVQQAVLDVQAARGNMVQAGLYPNPNIGLQWDSLGQAGTAGQPGGFLEQTIKTPGKLKLARDAAMTDVRVAELSLRHTEMDVLTQVRAGYFAVLVAEETVVVSRALAILAEDVYRIQIQLLQAGTAAPYEPLQLYVLSLQARGNLVQARNRYLSAWRQLAASLGQPDMPPTQLVGRADVLAPGYPFDALREHILNCNTELEAARWGIPKQQMLVRLARLQNCPDIATHFYVEKDNTSDPKRYQVGIQAGIAIPLWDRNQGNILQAQAQLAHANQEVPRVENDLVTRLADAYERYRNNVTLASYSRDSILPNQVRAYRAIFQRYRVAGTVAFADVVTAQQTLAQALQTYLQNLAAQWQAVVDLGRLVQTDDLYDLTPCPGQGAAPCPRVPVAEMLDVRLWIPAPQADAGPARATLGGPVVGPH